MMTSALFWLDKKISVCPIKPRTKHIDRQALVARSCTFADLKNRLPSKDDLEYWFGNGNRNMAVICSDNLTAIDFDCMEQYQRFQSEYPNLAHTVCIKSFRGRHLYYELSKKPPKGIISTWPDVEIKHNGSPILAAPSVHPSGRQYEVVRGGLLSRFSMLKLSDIFVLPMVADDTHSVKKEGERKPFPSTECVQGAHQNNPIQRIKSALSIGSYLESLHRTLTPTGDSKYITNCLFHSDKHPSMWVDGASDLCRCFKPGCHGHTNRPMDVLNLYQKLNGCNLSEAIKNLAATCGF